jgi:hypothetical protein
MFMRVDVGALVREYVRVCVLRLFLFHVFNTTGAQLPGL